MYYCTDCGKKFNAPKINYEKEDGKIVEMLFCPNCFSQEIREVAERYCKCCGRRLPDRKRWYCNNECKQRGEMLWKIQRERMRRKEGNSLLKITAKIEEYNKANKKNYSYGFFVANILPKMPKSQAKEYI